jgi:hypothetical protein
MLEKIKDTYRNIKYGLRNLYKWFPTIWKDRDWDYVFILEVLKVKLQNQAEALYGDIPDREYERMQTIIRLIDRVQHESYVDSLIERGNVTTEDLQDAFNKHDKARKLLFKLLEQRIEHWWD